ncbi:hypothetical protein BC827DRAFT_1129003 [Russula dissimulans]|nr:hypothetical protein BC827DRAFT_1129003 [Russula dissimulans]
MPARTLFLPGIVFLFCAFFLSLLVSISLPALPTLDIVRCHFTSGAAPHASTNTESIKEIRVHRAYCIYDAQTGHRTCIDPGHGYSVQLVSTSDNVTVGPGSTRGLAVHPVGITDTSTLLAAVATLIAFLLSLSSHVTLALWSSALSVIAAFLTLIALAIDIALYAIVHNRVHRLGNVQVHSVAAPGLWITLVSLILLLIAGCTAWFGRRRSRMSGATDYLAPEKTGLFSRFRRF